MLRPASCDVERFGKVGGAAKDGAGDGEGFYGVYIHDYGGENWFCGGEFFMILFFGWDLEMTQLFFSLRLLISA